MARPSSLSSMCNACRQRTITSRRTLTTTSSLRADDVPPKSNNPLHSLHQDLQRNPAKPTPSSTTTSNTESWTARIAADAQKRREAARRAAQLQTPEAAPSATTHSEVTRLLSNANAEAGTRPGAGVPSNEPYHLHVFAHKHNTHITFTEPSRNVILSFSCGSIGLRKAQRSSFDAAYQLATYTMKRMALVSWRQGGKKLVGNPMRSLAMLRDGRSGQPGIEVVMRGFGPGREAFQKALLGTEGANVRKRVERVTDATRLKFGGTRSPQVRRLG
ncbi:uncharacterized protein HMPREF1541_00412 [Cyphellophora europaea CBS 101466]|uniref:Ribosomal protein S11 n=1 Tax=Cyphellophora europaea (strain CBS 101466) TaxID=1220924 RepID=W2SDV1_CYPE1|nr:uncharacterized protein HMPREF1541_00412 [Cyphellophora europaea CBS 101466]ETN46228.1 hypothetical protein HMPREF1541_00412 [Cyphellophora europaea CBS 101466]